MQAANAGQPYAKMPHAVLDFLFGPDLTDRERRVLGHLCHESYRWGSEERWGSAVVTTRGEIAARVGLHPNHVGEALKRLAKNGWVTIESGRGGRNAYSLHLPTTPNQIGWATTTETGARQQPKRLASSNRIGCAPPMAVKEGSNQGTPARKPDGWLGVGAAVKHATRRGLPVGEVTDIDGDHVLVLFESTYVPCRPEELVPAA